MLKYKGDGFVRGYPAKDLTVKEVKQYGKSKLLATGLYKEVKRKPIKKADEE